MRIALLGDIALFGCFSVNENKKVKQYLQEISDYLTGFDLVIGNFETPFSVKQKKSGAKSAYICSDVENIEILKWLHIDAVNLANNHVFDFGDEGYETTVSLLDKAGIGHFGTEGQTWAYEKEGNKLLFSGFCCYSTNPLRIAAKQGEYGVNKYNIGDVSSLIRTTTEKGYLNIVGVHAGIEHVNYPSLDHVRAARKLSETCSYIYYGHHPHVIQGVEEYNGSLIAHSLGNFSFDDTYTDTSGDKPLVTLTEQNRTGMILELTVEDNKVVGWKEQMIYIGQDGSISLMQDDGRLSKYNNGLVKCEQAPELYTKSRMEVINARIAQRKAMRNTMWILRRLRPRFVRLILDARRNKKLYVENVKSFI